MMILLLAVIIIILLCVYICVQLIRPKNYPPGKFMFKDRWSFETFHGNISGPAWLPFVGNTPLLRKLAIECGGQHKAFEKMSEQFGEPIIGLKLGKELVVVAMTYPLVKEIHAREEFDGRPDNFFLRLRTLGTRWVFSVYRSAQRRLLNRLNW